MDPPCCVPPEASLGASEPSGHRPGRRGSEAGAGPRRAPRQGAGAERCSRVSTSARAPSLRRIQRADRLEEETRGGGWTGGAKGVRGISPEQPPLPGPDQNALGLWVLRRGVSFPNVSALPGTVSQPQREAAKNRGLVGPRGQETMSQGCHLLRPGLAASVRSRLCAHRAPRAVLSPTRNRPAARLPNKPPSPLPETPPFRDPRPHSNLTSPGAPPPLGLSPGPLFAAALPSRETRGARSAPSFALPGPCVPTLQQVEPSGCLRKRLHSVPRPRSRPQRQSPPADARRSAGSQGAAVLPPRARRSGEWVLKRRVRCLAGCARPSPARRGRSVPFSHISRLPVHPSTRCPSENHQTTGMWE